VFQFWNLPGKKTRPSLPQILPAATSASFVSTGECLAGTTRAHDSTVRWRGGPTTAAASRIKPFTATRPAALSCLPRIAGLPSPPVKQRWTLF